MCGRFRCNCTATGPRNRSAWRCGPCRAAKGGGAGTLGVVVLRNGVPHVLTVDHLAPKGSEIHQPAPMDGLSHRRIASLKGCYNLWVSQAMLTKSGRTTGITKARIDGIDADGVLSLTPPHPNEISCGGDSGSI